MAWRVGSTVSEMRRAFLADHARRAPLPMLLEAYGIKKSTAYALLRRARECPVDEAVSVRSRAPKSHPNQLGDDVIQRVVQLKKEFPRYGPKKLMRPYAERFHERPPSAASMYNILKAHGLTRVNRRYRKSPPPGVLTEASQPNDVWATDHKGRMDRLGVEPLTVIDLRSRFWLACRPFTDKSYKDTRTAFEALFDEFGLPRVMRVDGGQPWASSVSPLRLTKLSAWWVTLGIRVEVAPSCQLNGCVERLHGTMQREMNVEVSDVRSHFDKERRIYNNTRPHEALAMATPAEIYVRSTRRPIERTFDHVAIGCDEARPVQRDGTISWKGGYPMISRALAGRKVGLRRRTPTSWSAHFYELEIGTLTAEGFAPAYT